MSVFLSFLPEIIAEGGEVISSVATAVEGAAAGQGIIDLATTYAKQNPNSKLGQLLNDHSKHTPKVGKSFPKHRRKIG